MGDERRPEWALLAGDMAPAEYVRTISRRTLAQAVVILLLVIGRSIVWRYGSRNPADMGRAVALVLAGALLAVFIWWARSWVLGALWVAGEAAIWASWPAWAAPVFPPRVAVVCVWVVALVVFYVVRVRKAHSLADTKENLSRAGHHASAR